MQKNCRPPESSAVNLGPSGYLAAQPRNSCSPESVGANHPSASLSDSVAPIPVGDSLLRDSCALLTEQAFAPF